MIRALEFTATPRPIQLPPMTEGFGYGILINVWVRRTSTGVRQRIVDMATAASVHLFLGTGDQADTLTIGIEKGTQRQEVVALGALPLNRWVKVTAKVFSEFGTGFAILSIFDIDLAQGPTGVPPSGAFTDCRVAGGESGKPFVGDLSGLAISRLSPAGWGTPAKPPVQWAYYPLDKVTYSKTVTTNGVEVKYYSVDDTSTNNRDGLVTGELQSLEFASQTTGTIPVLALPGNFCTVRLSPLPSFSGKMTLETWFKPTSVTAQQTLLRLGDDGDVTLALTVGGNSTMGGYDLDLTLYQGTTALSLAHSNSSESKGVFQHLAVTISQGGLTSNKRAPITISLYLNGQLKTSATVLTSSLTTGTGTTTDGQQYLPLHRLINAAVINNVLLSGAVGASTHFAGQLSELRMWSVCRSGQEISSYFLSRAIGNETGLLACYRMEQRVSDCVFDISASHGLGKSPDDGSKVYTSDGTLVPKDFAMSTATNLPLFHTSNPADPHIVVKGKLTTEYMVYNTTSNATVVSGQVTVYDATLEPVLPDGTSTAGRTIQLSTENDVWVYLEQDSDIAQLTLWKAKQVYSVTVPLQGKLRLRFKAAYLSFTTLRVRFDDMPEGVWTMVRPDSENLANLADLSGASLLSPPPGKTSPLPAGTTSESANICADTLATIADCYRPSPNSATSGTARSALGNLTKAWKKTTDWTKDATNTAGSTLQKAGTSAGQFANALVDDGSVVLSQGGSAVKSASSLLCSNSIDYKDLIHAAANAVPRYGAPKIAEAIMSANRLAIVSHAQIGEIAHNISIIGTTIINGTTYVWRVVASGVWNAVTAMVNFLKKIGTDIQKMIEFLAWLFNWNDFLAASDGIYDSIVGALDQMPTTIEGVSQYTDQIKAALTPPSNVPTQSLSQLVGIDIPKNLGAKELDYVMELGYKLMGSANIEFAGLTKFSNDVLGMLPSVDTAKLESISDSLGDVASTVFSSATGLLTTPVNKLVSGLSNAAGALIDFLLEVVKTVSNALVTAISTLLTGRINVPHVSNWIENTILGGRDLNLLRIVSLAGAIVEVLIDKIGAAAEAGQAEPQAVSFSESDSGSQTKTALLCSNFTLSLALTLVQALRLAQESKWAEVPPKAADPNRGLKCAYDSITGIVIMVRSGLSIEANTKLPTVVRVPMNAQAVCELFAGLALIVWGVEKCAFSDGKNERWLNCTKMMDLALQSGFGAGAIISACVAGSHKDQFPNTLAWVSYGFQSIGYTFVQASLWTSALVDYKRKELGTTGPKVAFGLQVATLGCDLGAAITSYESNQLASS